MIEGHGDDLFRYKGKIKDNFSSNIFQNTDHKGLFQFLFGKSDLVSNYPPPVPAELERKIASEHNINPDEVLITSGATDGIYLIAMAFKQKRCIIAEPTFAEYEDASRLFNHEIDYIAYKEITDLKGIKNSIVWICNPNNPTGEVIRRSEILNVVRANPQSLFVIDAAYSDYTDALLPSVEEYIAIPNVLVLHSFTKRYCIPGIRVGHITGNSSLVRVLAKYRQPWAIGSVAIEAANYLLDRKDDRAIPLKLLLSEAKRVRDALIGRGIEVNQSVTNFLLCKLPDGKSSDLKEYLIERYGILIRDASNFHGLDERYFRVAVQTPEANDRLIKSICQWLSR